MIFQTKTQAKSFPIELGPCWAVCSRPSAAAAAGSRSRALGIRKTALTAAFDSPALAACTRSPACLAVEGRNRVLASRSRSAAVAAAEAAGRRNRGSAAAGSRGSWADRRWSARRSRGSPRRSRPSCTWDGGTDGCQPGFDHGIELFSVAVWSDSKRQGCVNFGSTLDQIRLSGI